MTALEVKEALLKVYSAEKDFTVTLSPKKSETVNGLYKLPGAEIVINLGNFTEDGELNENLMMYTAIHELAHHVLYTELGQKGSRSHSRLFWGTFHDFIEKAEASGVYHLEIDREIGELLDEARGISREIASLERKLGSVIQRITALCEKKGLRTEDILERGAQLSRETTRKATSAYYLNSPIETGMDIQAEAVKAKNKDEAEAVLQAGRRGKTIAQIRNPEGLEREEKKDEVVETELIRARNRITRRIETLRIVLRQITVRLEAMAARRGETRLEAG